MWQAEHGTELVSYNESLCHRYVHTNTAVLSINSSKRAEKEGCLEEERVEEQSVDEHCVEEQELNDLEKKRQHVVSELDQNAQQRTELKNELRSIDERIEELRPRATVSA